MPTGHNQTRCTTWNQAADSWGWAHSGHHNGFGADQAATVTGCFWNGSTFSICWLKPDGAKIFTSSTSMAKGPKWEKLGNFHFAPLAVSAVITVLSSYRLWNTPLLAAVLPVTVTYSVITVAPPFLCEMHHHLRASTGRSQLKGVGNTERSDQLNEPSRPQMFICMKTSWAPCWPAILCCLQ